MSSSTRGERVELAETRRFPGRDGASSLGISAAGARGASGLVLDARDAALHGRGRHAQQPLAGVEEVARVLEGVEAHDLRGGCVCRVVWCVLSAALRNAHCVLCDV